MRVVIVAANAVVAESIRRGMRHATNCHVVGFVDGRRPCAVTIADTAPDLVVIDDMDTRDVALARISEVRAAVQNAKVVLLTGSMSADWLAAARDVGINAAISRDVGPASLGTVLREIAGGMVFHAFATEPAVSVAKTFDQLTPREMEILRLVTRGTSNSRIAADLWVTEQTVKFHLSNIYRKLDVANRTEAAHIAHLNGLTESALTPVATPAPAAVAA